MSEKMFSLKAIDGHCTAGAIAGPLGETTERATRLATVRRLGRRGVIDLISANGNGRS